MRVASLCRRSALITLASASLALAALSGAPPAVGQVAADSNWASGFALPGTAGNPPRITAVAVDGGNVYIGGTFKTVGDNPTGTMNNIAEWTGDHWAPLGSGTNGPVLALTVLDGTVYAGGDFSSAGGIAGTAGVAAWTGGQWTSLGGGLDTVGTTLLGSAKVRALTSQGGAVYAAGDFTHAGGVAANSVAAWRPGSGWSALGSGLMTMNAPGFESYVGQGYALASDGTDLLVGGQFRYAGGVAAQSYARWNGTSWSTEGSSSSTGGVVDALALAPDGTVYAGGCVQAGGLGGAGLAELTGTTWQAVGNVPCTDATPGVSALTFSADGQRLYAGGLFTAVGGISASHLAYLDATGWHQAGAGVSSTLGTDGSVLALVPLSGAAVIAGGSFDHAGASIVDGAAVFNGSSWQVSDGLLDDVATDGTTRAMAPWAGGVAVGGHFVQAGGLPANSMALWNGTDWRSLGGGVTTTAGGGAPVPGTVRALLVSNGLLYVGGEFDHAGSVAASNVAAWDGAHWHALGTGVSGRVNALAVIRGKIYVGGAVSRAGGLGVHKLAAWNPVARSWSRVGENPVYTGNPLYLNLDISALTTIGNRWLVVGGGFTKLYGTEGGKQTYSRAADGLLLFDTQAKPASGDAFSGYRIPGGVTGEPSVCPQPEVRALTVLADGSVAAAGCFTRAGVGSVSGSVATSGVAVWRVAGDNKWVALGGGVNGAVDAVTSAGSTVLVTGRFDTVGGGRGAHAVAAFARDTARWSSLGSGLGEIATSADEYPQPPEGRALLQTAAGLFVGGSFNRAGGVDAAGFAHWTATATP